MLKSGDKAISTVTRRSPKGLELSVKLHPMVEEFMKAAAGEEFTPVELFGRKWQAPQRLSVYDIPDSMNGATMLTNTTAFRLDRPGSDLFYTDPSTGLKTLNMSFIRLVGASLDDGITFSMAGAYNRDDTIWLGSALLEAGNIIYKQYIHPMIISTNIIIRMEQAPDEAVG